jgi:hypothetical protein
MRISACVPQNNRGIVSVFGVFQDCGHPGRVDSNCFTSSSATWSRVAAGGCFPTQGSSPLFLLLNDRLVENRFDAPGIHLSGSTLSGAQPLPSRTCLLGSWEGPLAFRSRSSDQTRRSSSWWEGGVCCGCGRERAASTSVRSFPCRGIRPPRCDRHEEADQRPGVDD